MKKIFMIFAAIAALSLATVSCDEETQFGVLYSVEAVGDADGDFTVTYPGGLTKLDGKAALECTWTNDTTAVLTTVDTPALTLEDALASDDEKVALAAAQVNAWVDEQFSATSACGTYFVHLKGYVKEKVTGLTVSIDKTLTNRK